MTRWLNLLILVTATFLLMETRGECEQPAPRNRVLVLGIDGTRPDALAKARTPHLDGLIREGSFTDTAEILGTRFQQNQTISGPGWTTNLTGVWADKHGVMDNSFKGQRIEAFPHFFKRLKAAHSGARTVSLVSWEPIHEFIVSDADIQETLPLPPVASPQTVDLRVPADKLKINTRDGHWHHLCATRSGGMVRLYLDGRLIGQQQDSSGKFRLDGQHYYIGRDPRSGDTCFRGCLDNVRLWQRALGEDEIRQHALPPADRHSLLAEYTFDAGAGQQLVDTAGHASGPYPAEAVSTARPARIRSVIDMQAGTFSPAHSLDLTDAASPEHGIRVPLQGSLPDLTLGDFTVESHFLTSDPGRNILFGNFASKAGALNLELHQDNSVRVYLQPPNAAPVSGLQREHERDRKMAETAARILKDDDPTAMFVYFHQVDSAGHSIGFSPDVPQYVQAIENVDGCIGTILNAMRSRATYDQENWLTIVCTDHGGFKRGHSDGHNIPEIRTVFLIVSGPAAKKGRIEEQVYLVDVSATALTHLLGQLEPRWQLDGQAVGLVK